MATTVTRSVRSFVALGVFLCASGGTTLSTSFFPDPGVKGVKAICFQVLDHGRSLQGNLASTLEIEMSNRLRSAGVPSSIESDCYRSPQHAAVILALHTSGVEGFQVSWFVHIELLQDARLLRNPQATVTEAVTWQNWRLGLASTISLEKAIRAASAELVDVFASVYRQENHVMGSG